MNKPKDLTPKLKSKLKTAEEEFTIEYQHGSLPFGQSVGGVSAFAQVFKRGYGENVFGVDANGMWLGGADFDTATIQFHYKGTVVIRDKDNDLKRVRFGLLEDV